MTASQNDKLLLILVLLSLSLVLVVVSNNIYNILYPPLIAPVIDVKAVQERIQQAGLEPREADFYRVIEKDRRGNVAVIQTHSSGQRPQP